MAENGIRSINLARDDSSAVREVLVHADSGGGALVLRRQRIEFFVQHLLGLAGLDPSGVADLSLRLTAEVERAIEAEEALGTAIDDERLRALSAEALLATRADSAAVPSVGRALRGRAVFSRQRRAADGFFFRPDTFDACTFVWVPARAVVKPIALQADLSAAGNAAVIRVRVYRRPLANLDGFAPGTGLAAGDELLFSYDAPVASLLADPLLTSPQPATIPLSGIAGVPDMPPVSDLAFGYLITLEARTAAGGATYLGAGYGTVPSAGTTARGRGWLRQPGGGWFPMGGSDSLSFTILEAIGVDQADRARPLTQSVTSVEALQSFWSVIRTDTTEAVLPEMVIEVAGQPLVLPRQLLVFSRPSQGTITDVIPIQPSVEIPLTHQFATGISATRQDNGAPLALGVDYAINPRRVSLLGLKAGVVFASVSYTGSKTRYDVVVLDPATGAVSVVGGTERGADAGEFLPEIPSGLIPLYNAFVTRNDGVDLIPVFPTPRRVLLKGLDWLEYNRQRLLGLLRKMRKGATIRLAGYGNSITELGGGPVTSGYYTTPNGTYRDTAWQNQGGYFWTGRIGADVVNGLPAYDTGDGNPRHVRVGWNWYLKAAIEAASACTVIYDNWGVGGTSAAQTEPNGNYPPRLNALIASAPDLVVIEFGMNELGSDFTYIRMRTLVQSLKRAGIECIVMGVPLIATSNSVNAISEWRETNARLELAALDEDVAFVPVAAFADPDSPTPLGGMSRRSVSTTNAINHDGPYMLGQYGQLLASIVKGL